jgi:zinc transport system substrate-binding protein
MLLKFDMKYILILISIIAIISCNSNTSKNDKKILSVSIYPQKYFIEQLAGDLFEVNVLIPSGASPATYEPTPKQLTEISKSEIYFQIGELIFEKVWLSNFQNNNKKLKVINLSENIVFEESIDDHSHSHSHKHSVDPHIWMSAKKTQIIIDNLYNSLVKNYPEYTDTFNVNYNKLKEAISNVDRLFINKTQELKQKNFLIFHPALTYLANDYGLTQISIEFEGKEPSPVHLKKIIEKARNLEIKTIFVQKEFNKENAQAIAKEINAQIVEIDPLGYDWKKTMIDILNKL